MNVLSHCRILHYVSFATHNKGAHHVYMVAWSHERPCIYHSLVFGHNSTSFLILNLRRYTPNSPLEVATLRPGLLGKHRDEFAYRYCGRRLCPRQGRSQAKRYDNSGVARPQELHGLLNKVRSMSATIHP